MQAEGCECWEPSESLAVMGLFEVLSHLPRLLRLRKSIRERLLAARPDVFVGVDAPEFNLNLAPALHQAGIPTVQYVSPQVWAWRQGRVAKMARFLDLVLCLLPFEKRFYDEHGLGCRVRRASAGRPGSAGRRSAWPRGPRWACRRTGKSSR